MSAVGPTGSASGARPPKIVPVRHPGRWVAAGVILVVVAMMIHTLISHIPSQTGRGTQWRFGWDQVGALIFTSPYVSGAELTLWLTFVAMSIGIIGGLITAVLRLSANPILSGCAFLFTWFFRGTPVIVQIFFWYNILSIYPKLSLGIPFGTEFVHLNPSKVITGFVAAAILGLGVNEAAYMSEIVRAGFLSVDVGQSEAAASLGMGRALTTRRILLPQAMRVIIPPTGNEVISMLKLTSLASFVGIAELNYQASATAARTFAPIPPLIAISLWYLAFTTVLSIIQYFIERRFSRGFGRARTGPRFWEVMRRPFAIRRQPSPVPTLVHHTVAA